MASGNLQRRHQKAVHRKKLLAQRRRLEAADPNGTLAKDVRRAAAAPLHSCFAQDGLFEAGLGMVILTRKTGGDRFATASFLVDVYCLGVKNVLFRETDETEMKFFLETVEAGAPLAHVDPPYARKLLRDAVAYAQSLGLAPHADYAAVEPLFADVAPDACDAQFQFGCEGKPRYIPGPFESPTQVRRRLDLLHRRLGAGGFDFVEAVDAEDALAEMDEDEDVDIDAAYDPAIAPDPAQWLALDEDERMRRVEDYHRRAGVSLPNETLHAVLHVAIENQIAMGDELPVRRAVDRLMREGLDRHEAIHAVGTVLTERLNEALKDPEAKAFQKEAYNAAIERITAESWRRYWEDAED
jgi:Domain of unknown function (DUF1841)